MTLNETMFKNKFKCNIDTDTLTNTNSNNDAYNSES